MGFQRHHYLVFKDLGFLANKLWTRGSGEMANDEDGPIAQLARAHP